MEKIKERPERSTGAQEDKNRRNKKKNWFLILLVLLSGCFMINKPPPESAAYYEAKFKSCSEMNIRLIELWSECEKDLEACHRAGSAIEDCP